MDTIAFNQLISKSICDTGCDLDTIGFVAKHNNYEMNFYCSGDEGYKVCVDDFGKMVKGKWQQFEPSEDQLQEMSKILNAKKEELFSSSREEELVEEFDGDYYNLYGVKRSDFY